ncbi:HelD family protein [Haloimpatiens lingqiaonensis]|uniref:HelD family protein n=1 Tax=Haloimpatiens lingqiaonensis TaxID=1380675 RepID=UPI0010FDC758|nr:UvrD-helicase domain-containing protein [Haloimpatiens lingqiaonensis]
MEKEENKMSKEIDLHIEKQHLDYVIKSIKEEILNYINKRNKITENLLDYRKKVIEEYKDDEDKMIEYFDHERFVQEETYKTIDKKLKEMAILQTSPYFGRVDFLDKEFDEEDKIYVGRFGFTREEDYEPVVVDWRAPIASLFYAGKLGETDYSAPSGKVPVDILNKRQYVIKHENLVGMFDSSIDIKDEILQMVLSKNAEEKLKDIIMTIQKEQDEIIRESKDKTVVVDGVAGSGKTTIALHRVAYLLYNYRKSLQDKVVIFGPNNVFMEYISMVLPSLGETGVKQTTFTDFACTLLGINRLMDLGTYMENIIGGDVEFINEVKYKTSLEYKEKMDSVIDEMNRDLFKIKDVKLAGQIVLKEKEIKNLFYEYYNYMPLFRRSKKIKRIIFSKIRDVRDELVREINLEYKKAIEKLSKEELELEGSFLELKRKIRIREIVKEVIITKKSLKWLNSRDCIDIYNDINGNKELTIDDLAPILYLKIKLDGFKYNEEVKHVVIDEAQDYSYLQFIVIKELLNPISMTVVGDGNQRLIPLEGKIPMSSMSQFISGLDVEYFKLEKSYRSTARIMRYANKYLGDNSIVPMVREGRPVAQEEYKSSEELKELILSNIEEIKERECESIGIICKDLFDARKVYNLLKDKIYIKLIDEEDSIYKGGLVIIPSYYAKGLEFDGIILVDKDMDSEQMNKIKYVMSTRALHELVVLKGK